jgi:hypothetical protein
MFNCVLCKKTFCTKFNLERHTNSCKGNPIITKFKCDYCLKYYATKQTLQNHHENCSKRHDINKQLKDVNLKMKELENKLLKQELNTKPQVINNTTNNITNNNNNTINNYILYGLEPLDLSQKRFDNIVQDKYNYNTLKNVRLVREVILKFFSNEQDKIVALVGDINRMTIKCINDKLELQTHDPESLVNMCKASKPLKNKVNEYIEKDSYDVYGNKKNSCEEEYVTRDRYLRTDSKAMLSTLRSHREEFLQRKKKVHLKSKKEPQIEDKELKIIFVED